MAPPQIDDTSQTAAVPQKSKLPLILTATLLVWLIAIGGFFVWKNQQIKQLKAEQTAALISDIENADDLIDGRQYEEAIKAFDSIPSDHASLFDPNQRRGRDDLVESGSLKAQALLAAQKNNYVTAHAKAKEYQRTINAAKSLPASVKTKLGRRDAQDLVDEYAARSAFQQRCNEIETLFTQGDLDQAIVAIRRLKSDIGTSVPQADLDQIAAFEKKHTELIADQRIASILQEANKLNAAGDLEDAVDLLETEIKDAGDEAHPQVVALAEQFNKRLQIQELEEELAEAEKSGDPAEILAAVIVLNQVQPTQSRKLLINELEIEIMLTEAEAARAQGNTERAEDILQRVLARDKGNTRAPKILASLEDARMKNETERKADELVSQGKYQEAITMYQEALTFGPDTDGSINEKIQNAVGQVHLAESEKALAAGDIATSQDRLDKARAALGGTDAIADLEERIDELREYTLLVDEGDTLFNKDEFGKTKAKYLDAKKIFDSQAINDKINNCDFGSWLEQTDGHILRREWQAADGALKRAEEIKTNDQTRARREQINNRVQ